MLKSDLRKIYLQKRKTLSSDEVFLLSEQISQQFVEFFKPKKNQNLHLFLPIAKFIEIETQFILNYCLENQIRVFVPKVIGEDLISVEILEDSVYKTSSWGIKEPISNVDSGILDYDFVITPLLYCDAKGNRVGYGKGFYDGFFENLSSKTKKIGINYFNPDESIDDVWENDIPLDYLVTPTEVLSFGEGFLKKLTK